jgi:hypothetical protein
MTDTPKKPHRIQPPAPPLPVAPGGQRPRGPVPVPAPVQPETPGTAERAKPDPTRFGDWEKNGRCIDF